MARGRRRPRPLRGRRSSPGERRRAVPGRCLAALDRRTDSPA